MKSIYPLVNSHITMERSTIHPASRGVAVFISVRERGSGWFSPVGATQAKNFHFPPPVGAPQAREFSLFPPVGAPQAREFSLSPRGGSPS